MIVEHVQDVGAGYLGNLGVRWTMDALAPDEALAHLRETILTALAAAVSGELPTHGPRGGVRWLPRTFVHRLAWHELDHTWEIEDRAG
jgi:hypothetical protein